TNRPLAGKRIVITRAPEQSGELVRALEDLGAEVLSMPAVAFAPPEDWRALDDALRNLESFDAVLFLSRNAVRYLLARSDELGIKCPALGSSDRLLAAVGPGTAEEAGKYGVKVNFVAKNRTGESLVRELRDRLAGRAVLLPRSDRGDARISSALREAGANVTEVVAYRTIAPKELDPPIVSDIRRAEVDAIVFASPSAYRNLCDAIGTAAMKKIGERVHFAAIGPATARAIRDSGARAGIEISDPSTIGVQSLADSLAEFFQRNSAAAPARSS
ncbi:MAG: uroporphyrinogen-III synthase, partial [Acidobacteriota bacterium]|nr:uroporphyrinogen-III synthase [Acidobacteriota bacterium]